MASAVVVLISACAKDKVQLVEEPVSNTECSSTISYNSQVRPIIELNCATSGCHDASTSGGYQFLTYADVSQHAEIIRKTIKHEAGVQIMPKGLPKLNDSLIKTFDCWITQGTLNN